MDTLEERKQALDAKRDEWRALEDQWTGMCYRADALMRAPDGGTRKASEPEWREGHRLYCESEPIRARATRLRAEWSADVKAFYADAAALATA